MQALRTAATGMAAQQLNVEVISNNIANMNTVAFKRQRAEFQDLLYQTLETAGAQSSDQGTIVPTGVQIGAGVKAGSVYRIPTQGTMTRTDNDYDIAIDGRGYLQVLLPSGETAYTRAGNLSINDQGQLVTGTLMDYAAPKAEFLPMFENDRTETPSPLNPLGAKGIGELATIGSTPTIVNAVVDALAPFGVKHLDMPLRPERIWQAIAQARPSDAAAD